MHLPEAARWLPALWAEVLALGVQGCASQQRAEVGTGRIRDRLSYELIEVKVSLVYVRWPVLESGGRGLLGRVRFSETFFFSIGKVLCKGEISRPFFDDLWSHSKSCRKPSESLLCSTI